MCRIFLSCISLNIIQVCKGSRQIYVLASVMVHQYTIFENVQVLQNCLKLERSNYSIKK